MAKAAQSALQLDRVEWIPLYQAVHRAGPQASSDQRERMLELLLEPEPQQLINRIEIERGGASYMVDTLRLLQQQRSSDTFFLLLGTDAFEGFSRWKEPQQILKLCHLAVLSRPGYRLPPDAPVADSVQVDEQSLPANRFGKIYTLEFAALNVSSTEVRQALQDCAFDTLKQSLSPPVLNYIQEQGLYSGRPRNH